MRSTSLLLIATLAVLAALPACQPQRGAADEGLKVVASTTMLADLARVLLGDDATIESLISPGGDPHVYEPTPANARAVSTSDITIRHGLHLEGWIDDLIASSGADKMVITATEDIEPLRAEGFAAGVDPHVWLDPELWSDVARTVASALSEELDTEAATRLESRLDEYLRELEELDDWVDGCMSSIPEAQRVLITSHDAFNYFGRAYDVEVVGIQGISTEQEASQRDVIDTIELVRERDVPAIFVETSVNSSLIEQVARETGVTVAGPLYSDSVGESGSGAETVVGMIVANTRIIADAMGARCPSYERAE